MVTWIPWEEVRSELMKNPEIAENYESEYEEFCKQVDAERAAERAQAFFSHYKKHHNIKRQTLLRRHRHSYATGTHA